jgi:hypothetical protein
MGRIDFKREASYKALRTPDFVDIPDMLFATVEGEGAPEQNRDFQEAIQALYGTLYTIKFWAKKHPAPKGYSDFSVMPLEGLWWTDNGQPLDPAKPQGWRWKLMLRVPEFVTPAFFKQVIDELGTRKPSPTLPKTRLEHFKEGACVQIMHIGPYDKEEADIAQMHEFAAHKGYRLIGKHHELYFDDPRRTRPEKLRTILRQPVR